MPGQGDLGEDDDPVHVLLNENNVAMLLFRDEKDIAIGAPAVASALASKKTRGAQSLERSALLGEIFLSAEDDASGREADLGDTLGATPSAGARAAAARGVAGPGGGKAPLKLPSPAGGGTKLFLGTPTATAGLRPPTSTSASGGRVGDTTFASVLRPLARGASTAPTSTARQLRSAPIPSSAQVTGAGQVFQEPQLSMPGRGAPTLNQGIMGPQAGVQGVDLAREELDFQTEEISAADIRAMAAVALAGLGAGKKATSVKVGFGEENRKLRDCIMFGLSEREVAMAVPTVVSLLVEHMDLRVPLDGDLLQGSSQYVQRQLELLDLIVERGAQQLGCASGVLMSRIHSADTSETVQSAFKRTRAFMDILTRSYAADACDSRLSAGNSVGGAAEGRSFQFTGPGLNSIRYGGPGTIHPGICRGGSLDSQARDSLFDYVDRSSKGKGVQQRPLRMKSGGDGLGEVPRCFVSAGGDDDDSGKKTSKSTMQEDAFLQSAYNVSEDSTLRDELSDLKNSVESDPLSRHAAKIKAFGICATSAPDLMNLLTSANIVVPKGKSDLLPEFLMPVVRAVMRIQSKVLAAMEALLRDLLYYDAMVKPMAKCLITMDLSSLDLKAVMGREGISKLGLDKSKSDAKVAPSTAAFHAVWPVLLAPPFTLCVRRMERTTGDNGLSLLVSDCKFFCCGKNTRRDTIGK